MAEWVYVSIGDSWSLDDYTGVEGGGAAALMFRNHPMWADFDGKDIASTHPDATHVDLCSDGAKFPDILRRQISDVPTSGVKLITVTCGTQEIFRNLQAYAPGFVEKERLDSLADDAVEKIDTILGKLRPLAVNAPIIMHNLYDPSDGKNKIDNWVTWPQMGRYIDKLNERIANLCAKHGAEIVDVRAAFSGHGATANATNRWVVNITELNAKGADGLRRLWWEKLAELNLV